MPRYFEWPQLFCTECRRHVWHSLLDDDGKVEVQCGCPGSVDGKNYSAIMYLKETGIGKVQAEVDAAVRGEVVDAESL